MWIIRRKQRCVIREQIQQLLCRSCHASINLTKSVQPTCCLAADGSHGTKKVDKSRVDLIIRVLACATVIMLACIAAAISYSHMHELAIPHGETGWRAHAFPLSVDGIEPTASLVLLAHRRAGTHAGLLPWVAVGGKRWPIRRLHDAVRLTTPGPRYSARRDHRAPPPPCEFGRVVVGWSAGFPAVGGAHIRVPEAIAAEADLAS